MGYVKPGLPTYDLTGRVFGRLEVLYWINDGKIKWICRCECGNLDAILTGSLLRGDRSSCGCYHNTVPNGHGQSYTRTYKIWQGIKSRCNNPKDTGYKWYGEKGVKVSEDWDKSFENFFSDMGACPIGMEIDRIIPEGDYTKQNCRWVTKQENYNNRRGSNFTRTLSTLSTEQLEELLQYLRSKEEE